MKDLQDHGYAWVVVGGAFVSLAIIFGVSYSFAAFFQSFATEFSANRADVSWVFGLSGLLYFVLGAGGGMLADRFGPRAVCCAGMLFMAAGLFATSMANSLHMVYATYCIGIGVGIALVYTPSIACVQPWFTTRRGLAAGIASAGIGAGTVLVPLLATRAIEAWQWRDAMQALALGVLVLGLAAASVLRRAPLPQHAASPVSRGSAHSNLGTPSAMTGSSLSEALRDRRFHWFYLSVLAAAPTMFIPFAHVSASARDLGVSDARAVGLVGLIGVGSLVGRFAIGALADRFGRTRTVVAMQVSMGASCALWMLSGGYPSMIIFALWFGLSYGGIVSLLPAICMDMFGAKAVAGIVGTLYTGAALGNLLGPVLAGLVFDRTGSYTGVLWGCMALSVVATLAAARLIKSPGHVF